MIEKILSGNEIAMHELKKDTKDENAPLKKDGIEISLKNKLEKTKFLLRSIKKEFSSDLTKSIE
jgi:hypothetical protein